jgi:hypothetical protein
MEKTPARAHLNGRTGGWSIPPNRATLDRVDSTKGYTRDNVAFVSHRANRLKNNATAEELQAIIAYMDKYANR